MDNILVSVVMITYGHEKYIKEAIDGILMQQFQGSIELIVSNDKSLDATDEVVREIISNHPNGKWIKYINHVKNLSILPNLIFTLKEARGGYIAICDGDDYWTDNLKLQKQVDFLESNKSVVSCGGYVDVKFFDDLQNSNIAKDIIILTKNNDLYYRHPFATLTMMFRSENIKELLNYKFVVGDVDLFHYLSKFGDFALLPYKFGVYRFHGNGVNSGNNHFFNKRKQINAVVKVSNTFNIPDYRINLRKKLIREIFNNLKNLRHGEIKNNLEFSFFCIKTLISKT